MIVSATKPESRFFHRNGLPAALKASTSLASRQELQPLATSRVISE